MQNTTIQNKEKAKSHLPHKHTTFSKREPALLSAPPIDIGTACGVPYPFEPARMRYLGLYFSFQILLRKVIR